jgi:hypothetical protein
VSKIAIVRDERYIVIEADLRDERIGDFGFVARADYMREQLARPNPVAFRDFEQRQTGEHRRSLFTGPIAQDLGEYDRRQNHAPMLDRLHDRGNVGTRCA